MADRSTEPGADERDALAQALALLRGAATPADRLAALALALERPAASGDASGESSAEPDELARCFARAGHLVARGGAAALLREALAYPEGSSVRRGAEAAALAPGAPPVLAVRRASTRPFDDGKLRTLETGGSTAGGVQLSADGLRLYTFVWGSAGWLDGDGDSRFQMWSTATGELLLEARAGQFRADNGSLAVSSDERTVAVRSHRDIAIFDLDVAGRALRRRAVLSGCEGPYALTFLDERRLVADDSSFEMVLWDTASGQRLAAAPSVGWHAHAAIAGNTRLLVAGCAMTPGRMIGAHALPSLAHDGVFAAPQLQRARSEALDVSPAERLVATGDTLGEVSLWEVAALRDEAQASNVRAPVEVPARVVGAHGSDVTCVRFVGEERLLSGDWHGELKLWDLARPHASPRPLCGHSGGVTGIAVEPQRRFAATSGQDGLVFLWDLRGEGRLPPRPIPPGRVSRVLRRQPDGLAVITDGVSVLIPLPPALGLSAAPAPQDPELVGVHLGGGLIVVAVDDPGPPELQLRRGAASGGAAAELVDTLALEEHSGGLCALDPRTFAAVVRGHVDFYQLR